MKRLLTAGLLLGTALHSLFAAATTVRVSARDTVSVEFPGVTAAFAVDADIVEASAAGNRLLLTGRRAGQTLVTVVMPDNVETLTVNVTAPAGTAAVLSGQGGARPAGSLELGYDSGNRRYSAGLDMPFGSGERTGRLRLYGIREDALADGEENWALPSASLELRQGQRRLVLMDELASLSPLTLDRNVLRGIHLHDGALDVHAGIAATTPWNDLLVPSSDEHAAGIAYRFGTGPVQLVPRLLWLPDSPAAVPGVAALGLERGSLQTPLWLKAELGWSDRPGASFDLNFHNPQRQVWLQGSTRPDGFAALSVARPAGDYLDGAWTEALSRRLAGSLTLSGSRLDLPGREPESASLRAELRHQTTERWSFTGGAGASTYSDAGSAPLERRTASLGAAYDRSAFGIAALYRYQESSAAHRAGHGGRLNLRAGRGPWRANLFVDAQQQSPTLDLVFQDRPDLARAFAELGFVASTPEEVIRLLRDNAALFAARGIELGELHVSPLRLQGGLNLAWREAGARRPELGLRLLADAAQGNVGERNTLLSTVYGSWPLFRNAELLASYTHWSAERDALPDQQRDSWQLTLRTRFAAPPLPGSSRRAISGRVLRDEAGTGEVDDAQTPLAGIEVVLDGVHRTRTDADGRFRFTAAGPGEHRVQAMLPPEPGTYFTRPSSVQLGAGGEALFAITYSAARLDGTLRSDAGLPLAGVRLRLSGPTDAVAITDSSGGFTFAGPEGVAQVSVVAETVPPGYELGDLRPRAVLLSKRAPATVDFRARAQRVLSGEVRGATDTDLLTVTAVEAKQVAGLDGSRRFLFRGLPAGPLTLLVKSRRGETRQVVEIPAAPATISGIELAAPGAR
ncbi:MAG: hypothetical protein K0S16_831 [Moraxellaceae bacterium]|nr:hypothetical protein [Moraxellaceae bacterium]